MRNQIKNVFISHIHEDDEVLQNLKKLLSDNGYEIRDSSIDSSTPNNAKSEEYIKSEILAPGINWAGTVIVLISPKTHESQWVEWEIEHAHKQGKRIVGVWAQGATDSDAPRAMEKYADAVVGWQAERVMDAIIGKIDNWTTVEGQIRAPRRIDRIACQ